MESLASAGSSNHGMDVKEPDQAAGAAGEPAPEPADADGALETQVEAPVDLLLGCCIDSPRADGCFPKTRGCRNSAVTQLWECLC